MISNNKIVHGLWIGDELSPIELLTINSFLAHGHEFHLWAYEALNNQLPLGVIVQDANEILSKENIFRYRNTNTRGFGKGSYAGYSDIFRYKLLFDKGGWWADMDITCLKPLAFSEPYVFRNHNMLAVMGNLMKCPKGSQLMKDCFDNATEQVDAESTDWLKAVLILNEQIIRHQLSKYIKKDMANPDIWELVDLYRFYPVNALNNYYVIHWMNEGYRSSKIGKKNIIRGSLLDKLMTKYGVPAKRIDFSTTNMSRKYL